MSGNRDLLKPGPDAIIMTAEVAGSQPRSGDMTIDDNPKNLQTPKQLVSVGFPFLWAIFLVLAPWFPIPDSRCNEFLPVLPCASCAAQRALIAA